MIPLNLLIQVGNIDVIVLDCKASFDDNALYISFNNFDSKPDKIRAPLTRRDAYMDGFNTVSDFVGFAIDSRNDDFNGKWFGVNAAGVKIDVNMVSKAS